MKWKAALQQATQSGMTTALGLLKSGKLILRCTSDRCDAMKLLGERHEKFDMVSLTKKFFSTEPRNPLWSRDRSGRPDIDSQEKSIASTIRHWKRWSRIGMINRIKIIRESGEWSSAKKTEKNFQCYRRWRKHSMIWGMFMAVTMESAVFMGKNYLINCPLHCDHDRSHTQTNVRHIYEIGVWARSDFKIGNNWLGKSFMEICVINSWRKNHQSSAHKSLRLLGFCLVSWEDPAKSWI